MVASGAIILDADILQSLLPVPFHPSVAELCIKNRKHLVTASYISPAMRELHDRYVIVNILHAAAILRTSTPSAVEADIILMNEIGLDPGIDHLYAVKTIDEVHKAGGKVRLHLLCLHLISHTDLHDR